jgi:tripartite-type tricarboxylate transporter receptor subunit TctC
MRHFITILQARESGMELLHMPYKGGWAAMQSVAAGDIAAALATEAAARPFHDTGKLRILATTVAVRSATCKDAPTFAELGFANPTQREWFGVFLRAGVTSSQVTGLAAVLDVVAHEGDTIDAWSRGGSPAASSQRSLERKIADEPSFGRHADVAIDGKATPTWLPDSMTRSNSPGVARRRLQTSREDACTSSNSICECSAPAGSR